VNACERGSRVSKCWSRRDTFRCISNKFWMVCEMSNIVGLEVQSVIYHFVWLLKVARARNGEVMRDRSTSRRAPEHEP